jgi:hypothetical protein
VKDHKANSESESEEEGHSDLN